MLPNVLCSCFSGWFQNNIEVFILTKLRGSNSIFSSCYGSHAQLMLAISDDFKRKHGETDWYHKQEANSLTESEITRMMAPATTSGKR